jgi:hypothetical protein
LQNVGQNEKYKNAWNTLKNNWTLNPDLVQKTAPTANPIVNKTAFLAPTGHFLIPLQAKPAAQPILAFKPTLQHL